MSHDDLGLILQIAENENCLDSVLTVRIEVVRKIKTTQNLD